MRSYTSSKSGPHRPVDMKEICAPWCHITTATATRPWFYEQCRRNGFPQNKKPTNLIDGVARVLKGATINGASTYAE
ncbi:hypothetical protein TGRH88_005040 [Toxoplasma gondii]|uniref:Uncharacterized protein n=1 Tax=Toxoplasma gondii TaxID=5811 RepID=A0A7J6KEL7_TOXGO|nr:hypothetical protein TGRH88_005040 [Toxoplasma gondii]